MRWAIEYRPMDSLVEAMMEALELHGSEWFVVGRSDSLMMERGYPTRAKAVKALAKIGEMDIADLEANWASAVFKRGT